MLYFTGSANATKEKLVRREMPTGAATIVLVSFLAACTSASTTPGATASTTMATIAAIGTARRTPSRFKLRKLKFMCRFYRFCQRFASPVAELF